MDNFFTYVVVAIVVAFGTACVMDDNAKVRVQTAAEMGYFEGQKDAMNGDTRIDIKTCEWIKSPWNNPSKILFEPNRINCNESSIIR